MKIRDVTDRSKSSGYHIIKLVEKDPGGQKELSDTRIKSQINAHIQPQGPDARAFSGVRGIKLRLPITSPSEFSRQEIDNV
jgi:hypothetical protein